MPQFARVSDDTFMVVLEARDPQFRLDDARGFLQSLGGQEITVIRD
ncbi:MAG: quinol:electron acceptor oxidoreductase subunit ActD [Opitutia bacterium]